MSWKRAMRKNGRDVLPCAHSFNNLPDPETGLSLTFCGKRFKLAGPQHNGTFVQLCAECLRIGALAGPIIDAIVTPTPTHHADGLPRLRLTADLTARLLESCAGDWTNAELRLAEIVTEAIH